MSFVKTTITAAALLGLHLGAASAQTPSILNEVLNSGVLKVGTTGDWNPMTMKDIATNTYKGYDIDVMMEMAQDLGVKVEFVATDWKTLVAGLTSGKYQITGSASMSAARAKAAGFSDSYFSLATVPIINARDEGKYRTWEDLDKPDVTVAATLGTTQEQQVKDFFPNAQKKIVEAPARDYQEVLAGRATANITSNVEAFKLVKQYPNLRIVPVTAARARTPVAMLMPQGDQIWINYVDSWITLKKDAGFFDELAKKWELSN